jgi:hypothetical protein
VDMIDALVASAIIMMVWGFIKRFRLALRQVQAERAIADPSFKAPLIVNIKAEIDESGKTVYSVLAVGTHQLLIQSGTLADVYKLLRITYHDKHIFFSTDDGDLIALFLPKDAK